MSLLQPGQQLLHYQVVEKIGAGGMGEVFKAVDTKLGRPVAIKTLPADADPDRTARRRFLQEARAASALNHPGIVTIYAIETAGDTDFIVMEYVAGTSVDTKIADGPVALREVLELGIQMADTLATAHAAGIVHRDVKPANIMVLPNGHYKLLDFGLVKPTPVTESPASTTMGLTEPRARVGSPTCLQDRRVENRSTGAPTRSRSAVCYTRPPAAHARSTAQARCPSCTPSRR